MWRSRGPSARQSSWPIRACMRSAAERPSKWHWSTCFAGSPRLRSDGPVAEVGPRTIGRYPHRYGCVRCDNLSSPENRGVGRVSELVRLYRYKELLAGRRSLSAEALRDTLEISPATLKRDIAKLRDQLHVPIRFDKDLAGYVIDGGHTDSELPGLWFSPEEIL